MSPAISQLVSKAVKMFMFFDPVIPLLRAVPRQITRNEPIDLFTKMLIVPLLL